MAKRIQLTIKVTYLMSWGAAEGVRELVQNARDAEVEHGAPMTIDWRSETLRIENEGTTLPTAALLLGHTTKTGNTDLIGKFGEGLKLGILALVRAGHAVKIRNGSEVWTPGIERSEIFGEDVLTFRIEEGRKQENRIRIEVGGISQPEWRKMRAGFLFIERPAEDEIVETYHGRLLMGPAHKGRVYVKGIYVQSDPEAAFGYDLRDVDLDRDRKMCEPWSLKYHAKNVLLAALNRREELFRPFVALLKTPTMETEGLANSFYEVSEEVAAKVASDFSLTYGVDAVPVASLAESKDVEHLGKRGIVVSKVHGAVLAKTFGSGLALTEALKKEIVKQYGWDDLTNHEKEVLLDAIDLASNGESIDLDEVDVVDFRSASLMGQYSRDTGRISIAKRLLADSSETLATIVHEAAHRDGSGDGDHSHVARIERIWGRIVKRLLRGGES